MEINTTLAEIVDVSTTRIDNFGNCLVEAAWAFSLDPTMHPQKRRSWTVSLGAAPSP